MSIPLATVADTVSVSVNVRDAPAARAPIVQIPDVVLKLVPLLPVADSKVTPAGRFEARTPKSDIVTPVAFELPSFRAVTKYIRFPTPLPAATVAGVADFVTTISTRRSTCVVTVCVLLVETESVSVTAERVAVLEISSVSEADAPTVSTTYKIAVSFVARFPIVQSPVLALNVELPLPVADTNVTPAGRLAVSTPISLTVTPLAFDGPLFCAVTV